MMRASPGRWSGIRAERRNRSSCGWCGRPPTMSTTQDRSDTCGPCKASRASAGHSPPPVGSGEELEVVLAERVENVEDEGAGPAGPAAVSNPAWNEVGVPRPERPPLPADLHLEF